MEASELAAALAIGLAAGLAGGLIGVGGGVVRKMDAVGVKCGLRER